MTGPLPDAILVFLSSFGLASCAGLASLLRSQRRLTALNVASAMLNSGLLGLGLALLWYRRLHDDVYALVGATILAGMGGAPFIEFVLGLSRKTLIKFFAALASRDGGTDADRTTAGRGDE